MFESIIHDSLNHILRAIGAFLILEPILLLWKKYIDKKEIPKWFSKQFIEEEIQTFFVFWLLTTLIHLPGYPIWIWFN